jgi:hypothetical protein
MAPSITLSDEQYEQLQRAAELANRTTDQLIADLLNWLPQFAPPLSPQEYTRRWSAFWEIAGSIQRGEPITKEDIDALIGKR